MSPPTAATRNAHKHNTDTDTHTHTTHTHTHTHTHTDTHTHHTHTTHTQTHTHTPPHAHTHINQINPHQEETVCLNHKQNERSQCFSLSNSRTGTNCFKLQSIINVSDTGGIYPRHDVSDNLDSKQASSKRTTEVCTRQNNMLGAKCMFFDVNKYSKQGFLYSEGCVIGSCCDALGLRFWIKLME